MDMRYRPQWQFSPKENWSNDPNGLVYHQGIYHLFYQYHPYSCYWGPMHWGHATSRDLLHWEHQPIALYPDSLGMIFSGSAVSDVNNTSGLGDNDQPPLVCLFTHHGPHGLEQQSLAYSLDGIHFEKYPHNPVIPNPGYKDFRDPKVFWFGKEQRWGLVLAAGDHVEFFRSQDLIHWSFTGRFGPEGNCAPGVWECPDVFPMPTPEGEKWVLLVSMGMGRENGGSRTQYFVGQYDGSTFLSECERPHTLWLDHGPDSYAGVTFLGEPHGRRVLISWMSNWTYADKMPTEGYRGQMSLPIELRLVPTVRGYRLSGNVISSMEMLRGDSYDIWSETLPQGAMEMKLEGDAPFSIRLQNGIGEYVEFGVDDNKCIFLDRTYSGNMEIDPDFGRRYAIHRLETGPVHMYAILDHCAMTLFADHGTRMFSATLFPTQCFESIAVEGMVGGRCTPLIDSENFSPLP